MRIRARVYCPSHRPRQVLVPTRCSLPARSVGPRYPYAESILDDSRIQPYVHDCLVTVKEFGRTYRYRVFYKVHTKLRKNNSLMGLRGSMFVMRAAALEHRSVVNMREHDAALADFLVKKWVHQFYYSTPDNQCRFTRFARSILNAKTRGMRLPDQMTFHKSVWTT